MNCSRPWMIAVLVAGLAGMAPAADGISTGSLLDEMLDLDRLILTPEPAYVTRQFSSYDRNAKSPKEDWFANGDAGHFLRIEEKSGRKEHVMMDADGPGAVVRIWSANPAGTLRIYIDGADSPALEAPMADLLEGRHPALPSPLAARTAKGSNLYFPIPYAKHCQITSDQGGFYYHVGYRSYGHGTRVHSFATKDLQELAKQTARVARRLSTPRQVGMGAAELGRKKYQVTLEPGESKSLAEFNGPTLIHTFDVWISAADLAKAARGVLLTMTFDGEQTVESPLGDFFGAAPGLPAYESLALGIIAAEKPRLWCHWRMPCSKSAQIRLQNYTDQKVELEASLVTDVCNWSDRHLLFHAKWRIQRDIPARPFIDWTHLECTGMGRFVGGALFIHNSVDGWWGEGDEKIYVDNESFPSHFGTGSEDYYGYAWGSPELFVHAYHNQPRCDGPGTKGNTSLNRFHILDDIPFTKQFKFDMEHWHSDDKAVATRAAVSYWYARPGGSDKFRPIIREDLAAPNTR